MNTVCIAENPARGFRRVFASRADAERWLAVLWEHREERGEEQWPVRLTDEPVEFSSDCGDLAKQCLEYAARAKENPHACGRFIQLMEDVARVLSA